MNATLAPLPPEGHMASVNGIEMYYELHGEGEPLVMLHAFTQTGEVWQPFIPDFAAHFGLIVIDLRGHGRSTNDLDEFTHRQAAYDVFALLDQLGIGTLKAVGVCTGADVLLHMATQQPARIEAMVLISATPYITEQERAWERTISEDGGPFYLYVVQQRHVHGDAQLRALLRQARAFEHSYDDINFTPPYLSTITARTLIVHGDRDQFYPVPIPIELYTSIPHAYLWIIANAGHNPVFGEHRADFTQRAVQFLRGEWETK